METGGAHEHHNDSSPVWFWGRSIGRELSQRLGIPCYDKEFVKKVALETGFDEKFIEDRGSMSRLAPGLAPAWERTAWLEARA